MAFDRTYRAAGEKRDQVEKAGRAAATGVAGTDGNWPLTSSQQWPVKIGGPLVKHASYYWLLLAECYLMRLFTDMLQKITTLPVSTGIAGSYRLLLAIVRLDVELTLVRPRN